jgi:hypothetical protein
MPTPIAWYADAQAILDKEQKVKRTPIKRKSRPDADKVTPEVYEEVMRLDGFTCKARELDPHAGECRNQWGHPFSGTWRQSFGRLGAYLTLDHVSEQSTLGKRAPSDARHLIVLCWGHHLGHWATSHRYLEREYLASHRT